MPNTEMPDVEAVIGQPADIQFETFIDQHRLGLRSCLDGLTDEQARRTLVSSSTTLLGLVKHVTFVERVWFDGATTGRPRVEIGLPESRDASFSLDRDDTIASVRQAHVDACTSSRRSVAGMGLDELVLGNPRGPRPLRWVYMHVLRELAQHCGHADILREQILHPR